jgi:hypothetical protein
MNDLLYNAVQLFFVAVWLLTLVDCVLNETSTRRKVLWGLAILVFNVIGTLAYLLIRRPNRLKGK